MLWFSAVSAGKFCNNTINSSERFPAHPVHLVHHRKRASGNYLNYDIENRY